MSDKSAADTPTGEPYEAPTAVELDTSDGPGITAAGIVTNLAGSLSDARLKAGIRPL